MVQDADGPQGEVGHQCQGLVCNHRPEGHLLPDSYLAEAWLVPEVRIRGQGVRIPNPPLRHLSCIPDLHAVHGRCPSSY